METKRALSCVKRIRSGCGPTGVCHMEMLHLRLRCQALHHTVDVEAGSFLFSPTRLVPTCHCVTIHAMWVVKTKILTIKVNLCSKLLLKFMQPSISFLWSQCVFLYSARFHSSRKSKSCADGCLCIKSIDHGYGWNPPWPLWLCTHAPLSPVLPLVSFQGSGTHQANNKWICNWRVSN